MMTTSWNSSPIRESSYVDTASENQKLRAQRLYRPMSSPLQNRHGYCARDVARLRGKEERENRRQQRLELSREKVTEVQLTKEDEERLRKEAMDAEVDVDRLVAQEEQFQEEQHQEYLEQLEQILAQEQAELELHFSDMQLD